MSEAKFRSVFDTFEASLESALACVEDGKHYFTKKLNS